MMPYSSLYNTGRLVIKLHTLLSKRKEKGENKRKLPKEKPRGIDRQETRREGISVPGAMVKLVIPR